MSEIGNQDESQMNRNDHGFTLVEIVVVMVLISIIAAATLSRSITTDQINFVRQVDKIRQQIRYAQSLAMKRNETWGVKCSASEYWLFKYENFLDDNIAIRFPGEKIDKISLDDLGIDMNAYTLFFKSLGVPYKTSPFTRVTTDNPLNINLSAGSQTRTLVITPETGLIITQ
jgi:prepilin-type N-terminal cleavage/methylation domain-containing protein